MAKPRIPLPKQVEKVHKDPTKYTRRKGKQVDLEFLSDLCKIWQKGFQKTKSEEANDHASTSHQ
jgi:hypothetical protein